MSTQVQSPYMTRSARRKRTRAEADKENDSGFINEDILQPMDCSNAMLSDDDFGLNELSPNHPLTDDDASPHPPQSKRRRSSNHNHNKRVEDASYVLSLTLSVFKKCGPFHVAVSLCCDMWFD